MVSPKPVSLTQVDAEDYDGAFEPQPLVVVGPIPGGGGGGGAVDSVNGKTGTVVLNATDVGAAPTNHTQTISTITGLTDALAGKASTGDLDNTFGIATSAQDTANAANTLASTAVQPAALATLVPNTRTVAGKPLSADVTLAKGDVGLGNVDNTSDANKPVSTATTTQLNLKAPLASPAFTGTPTGITKAHVGLSNVDNTSDANKPVSTAQASAIAAKVGSPNSTVTGIAYYATVASLPATGTAGIIYYVDAV